MATQLYLEETQLLKAERNNTKREDYSPSITEMVSLSSLSKLTGFPEKLIKEELLLKQRIDENGQVPMQELRKAMVDYLNGTLTA